MGYTINTQTPMYVETCYACGIPFGMPEDFNDTLQRKGTSFYCPNGHSQAYTDLTEKQLKQEREKTARLTARLDQERAEREATERRLSAAKGQVTKIKNRVGRGVCPCCNRSFADLAAHMQTKHPDFAAPADAVPHV